jgi:hypothetical protein
MSEVKVGERVRVVIEATLTGQELDWVLTDHGRYNVGYFGVTKIEVIPELFVLPTKRWAQVVDGFGYLWTLSSDEPDVWYSLAGNSLGRGGLLERSGIRVISEGVDDE